MREDRVRFVALFVMAAVLSAIAVEPEALAKRKGKGGGQGVFGSIGGRSFAAKSNGRTDDGCVNGIYRPAEQILALAALECKGKGRRKRVKKNYQALALACGRFDPSTPPTPPFEIPCSAATYQEWKTGRFRQPVSSSTWQSHFIVDTATLYPSSSVRVRIEALEGNVLRAKVFGVFQDAAPPATGEKAIDGEIGIVVPVEVQ